MNPLIPLPFGKKKASELIWIEQPEKPNGEWVTRVLFENGPDVDFFLQDIDDDGIPEIIATEFFVHQRLAIYKCTRKLWSQCENGQGVEVEVVNDNDGPFFHAQYFDIDGDGKSEILASNNRRDKSGSVFAFEAQEKNGNRTWVKHVLADGYTPTRRWLPGRGAPGKVTAFFPVLQKQPELVKPHILVSGDDAGVIDLLVPTEQKFVFEDGVKLNYSSITAKMKLI